MKDRLVSAYEQYKATSSAHPSPSVGEISVGASGDEPDAGANLRQVLHAAVKRGDHETARKVLEEAPEAASSASRLRGTTALIHACRANDAAMVRLLLEAGAKAHQGDKDKNFPIWIALMSRNADIAELLCSHGVDPRQDSPIFRRSPRNFADAVPDRQTRMQLLAALDRGWDAYEAKSGGKPGH
jgi:ankyrin repeat protein